VEHITRLDRWFDEQLVQFKASVEARAYVVGVMTSFKSSSAMIGPNDSFVLAFSDARSKHDFAAFQRLADNILWMNVFLYPQIKSDIDVVEPIARLSYYSCHRMMRHKWKVFEELADTFPTIVNQLKHNLSPIVW
jgi:hypothetical protein